MPRGELEIVEIRRPTCRQLLRRRGAYCTVSPRRRAQRRGTPDRGADTHEWPEVQLLVLTVREELIAENPAMGRSRQPVSAPVPG